MLTYLEDTLKEALIVAREYNKVLQKFEDALEKAYGIKLLWCSEDLSKSAQFFVEQYDNMINTEQLPDLTLLNLPTIENWFSVSTKDCSIANDYYIYGNFRDVKTHTLNMNMRSGCDTYYTELVTDPKLIESLNKRDVPKSWTILHTGKVADVGITETVRGYFLVSKSVSPKDICHYVFGTEKEVANHVWHLNQAGITTHTHHVVSDLDLIQLLCDSRIPSVDLTGT